MSDSKFYNKNGSLKEYAFNCGYIEKTAFQNGGTVRLERKGPSHPFEVIVWFSDAELHNNVVNVIGNYRKSFSKLSDARKVYNLTIGTIRAMEKVAADGKYLKTLGE